MDDQKTPVPPIPKSSNSEDIHARFSRRRFSDEEVWEIRRRHLAGESKRSLMAEFNVTAPCMDDVIHGLRTYRDV